MVQFNGTQRRRGSRFAIAAFLIFVLGSATVLGFAIAERSNLISKLSESGARFLVCTLLLSFLISLSRGLPRSARMGVIFCSFFLSTELLCEVIEDIDALDHLPLVGRASHWRHMVEKSLVACWTCGTFFLLYVLMRELEDAQFQVVKQERLSALGQLASGVAHDLNNALTPVVLLSSLLKDEDVTPHQRLLLNQIQTGAEHAGGVVKQLQHFYRTGGHDHGEYEPLDLSEVVRESVNLTHYRLVDESLKQGVRNTIRVDAPESSFVLGNKTELIQVISNLLINAADAMPNGGCVRVSVKGTKERVTVEVSDEGVGMSAEQCARCFEPFYTTKEKGSGLGLSVCHGIGSRHRGDISVDSVATKGTVFTIRFPRVLERTSTTQPRCQFKNAAATRILIIDDEEPVRNALSALLTKSGIKVDHASNGSTGVRLAGSNRYDLVLTDVGMPGMNGNEVVTELRSIDPNMRIAVLSGWSHTQVTNSFLEQRAQPDFVLEKPIVSCEEILRCLAPTVDERRARGDSTSTA